MMITLPLAALLALGACGEDRSADADASAPKSLADYMSADAASFKERETKVQEAVRDCMREQGFEYIPVDPDALGVVRVGPGIKPSKEFTERNGYGISTMADPGAFEEQRSKDPNTKIRESLSKAEQEAYDRALFGNTVQAGPNGQVRIEIGPRGADDAAGMEPQGCMANAFREAHGEGDAEERQLMPKLEELENRIQADPRMVKATQAWAGCMADSGQSYSSPKEIRDDLQKRLQKLERTDGTAGGVPSFDEDGLRRLQEEERAIARADAACAEKHLDGVEAKVRKQLEAEFIEDNKGALDRASRS